MKSPFRTRRTALILAGSVEALVAAVAFNSSAFGASQIWRAIPADATWVGTGNWGASGVVTAPGLSTGAVTNDVATFNTALSGGIGGAGTPIVLDATRSIGGITFDTASVGAYVIGANAGNALILSNIGAGPGTHLVQMTSAVTASQVIAAPIKFVAPSSTNGSFGFLNNASSSSATLTLSGTVTNAVARPAIVVLDGTNTGTNAITGNISFTAATQSTPYLVKRGSGTWILSGTNVFSGTPMTSTDSNYGIQVLDGVLSLQNNQALGTSATANQLQVWIGNKSSTYTYNTTLTNTFTSVSGGTLELANNITLDNGLSLNLINGGTIRSSGSTTTNGRINLSTTAATSATISTVNAADVFTIGNGANDFTGGAADTVVTIGGVGRVILAQASNYAGGLSIANGSTLQINSDTALGTITTANVTLLGNGKLQIGTTANRAPTVVGLSSASSTAVVESNFAGTNLLTVNNATANTYAGILRNGVGTLALAKGGAGVLSLSGANTYTGATTIGAGTLNVTSSLGTSAVAVNNSGTLAGGGTLGGTVTVASGGRIAPGNGGNGTIGILTVSSLTLGVGSQLDYDITNTSTLDQITVSTSGGLTINGGQLNINGGTGLFTANGVYNLIGYTGALGGLATNLSVNGSNQDTANKSYTFNSNGSFVTLTIANAAVLASFWNADADGNWSTGPWTAGTPNAVGAFAAFGGGGTEITANRTISVDGAFTVGTISLNGAANNKTYTLAGGGGSLTLDNGATAAALTNTASSNTIASSVILTANGATTTVTSAADTLTLSGVVSGTGAMTKAGAGKLALTGVNTFVGNTAINAGAVLINSVNSLGDAANTVTINNATLQAIEDITTTRNITLGDAASVISVDATKTYSVGGVVSGSGALNKSGSGTLALTGTNTYTGGTVINAGTLAINTDSSLGDAANVSTINAATLETTANITTTRAITLANAASTIQTDIGTTYLVNGVFSGSGALNKTGAGTLTLTTASTYTGSTVLSGGVISVGNGGTTGSLGSGTVVFQGGTLTNSYNGNNTFGLGNAITVATGQTGTINMGNRFSLTGAVSGAGTLNVNLGTTVTRNDFSNNFSGFTGILNVAGSGTGRLLNNGGSFNTAGFASTTLDLGGTAFLQPITNSGGNTYLIGALSGSSATAGIAGATAGTGILSVGALNTSTTFAGHIDGNNALTKTGTGTLTLTGPNVYTGITTVSAGTLAIGNGGTTGNLGTNSVTDNAALVFNRSDALGVANNITGTGSLVQLGSGTTTLSGTNSVATLFARFGTASITGSTAATNYASIGQLSGDIGTLTVQGGGSLTVTTDLNVADLAGSTGTLNTAGTVSATSLYVGKNNDNLAPAATGTVNQSGGTVTVSGANGVILALNQNAVGTYNLNGGSLAVQKVSMSAGTSGVFNFNGGTLTASASNAGFMTGLSSANVLAGGALINTGAFNVTIAQPLLSGVVNDGGLTKSGSGVLTLTGNNTFTGATTVNAGTLEARAAGALGATTSVAVNSGGTLLLSGSGDRVNDNATVTLATSATGSFNTGGLSETVGALTLSADSVIDMGAGTSLLTFASAGATAWNGTLSIWNWTGTLGTASGTDQLLLTSSANNSSINFSNINFFSDGGITPIGFGSSFVPSGGGGEIVPVPEPSSVATVMGLLGLIGWRERRKASRLREGTRKGA